MDGEVLAIASDARGVAGLKLPKNRVLAEHYPLLRLRFTTAPDNAMATIAWRSEADIPRDKLARTGQIGSSEFWLYLAGNPHWDGNVEDLRLVLRGKPGDHFLIESMSLEPLSAQGLVLSNRFDWLSQDTWTQKSTNFHKVVPSGRGPFHPVSMVALFLLSVILGYALLSRIKRNSFDPRVVGAVIVIGWLVLDGLWIGRLINQVRATQQEFAGKPGEQKLQDGPDSTLYGFISEARELLDALENPRLFVASSGDYKGMRAAYYLYPHNVHWQRNGPELPDPRFLRRTDYIVVVPPSEIQIDKSRSALVLGDSHLIDIEPVLIRRTGMLLQVR